MATNPYTLGTVPRPAVNGWGEPQASRSLTWEATGANVPAAAIVAVAGEPWLQLWWGDRSLG